MRAEAERLEAAYNEPDWRQAELRWREHEAPLADIVFQARATTLLTPRGSAGDYARLLGAVATGTLLSPSVSATMRQYLEWPMELPGNAERFSAFGAKGGNLPGTLSDAFYLVPRTGPTAGQTRVVVLMLRDIPLAGYFSLSSSYVHQQLMLALATDPEFAERVRTTVTP